MKIQQYFWFIMVLLFSVGGFHMGVRATELKKDGSDAQQKPVVIAGNYCHKILYDTDLLTLSRDGNFTQTHHGCWGQEGSAYGKWVLEGKIVKLQTERAYDILKKMEGTSTSFDVLLSKGEWVLLHSNVRDYYEKNGSPDSMLYKKVVD